MKTFMGDIRKTLSERFGYKSHHTEEVGGGMLIAFKQKNPSEINDYFLKNKNIVEYKKQLKNPHYLTKTVENRNCSPLQMIMTSRNF